jgi:hypothetical protein
MTRITGALRARVRQQAKDRCGYCLAEQRRVMGVIQVDHIVSRSVGGTDEEDNLWLACSLCNGFKGSKTHGVDPVTGHREPLFNPRTEHWPAHFAWDGPRIVGRTGCGRATVRALQLNNAYAIRVRTEWALVGWHPPTDESE